MDGFNDEQLVERYLAGDKPALETLIKRYLDRIFGFAFSYAKNEALAQDIAQETFVKAWKNIRKFDTTKKFKPWIYAIAKNAALDHLKKKQAVPFSQLADDGSELPLEAVADDSCRPDAMYESSESDNWFEAAISKLSQKYRRVVVLRQEDMTFREIAKELGEPLHTVKSRYRRALIALRKTI